MQEVAQVTAQFTDTVESLQTQIDDMQLTIDALTAKINAMAEASTTTAETYVKLSDQQIMLFTSKNTYYQQAIGVFSNAPKVYVTSNLTVDGLTFNGTKVSKGQFYTMDGVAMSTTCSLKDTQWSRGYRYTYTISFGAAEITFTPKEVEWVGEGKSVTIQ